MNEEMSARIIFNYLAGHCRKYFLNPVEDDLLSPSQKLELAREVAWFFDERLGGRIAADRSTAGKAKPGCVDTDGGVQDAQPRSRDGLSSKER